MTLRPLRRNRRVGCDEQCGVHLRCDVAWSANRRSFHRRYRLVHPAHRNRHNICPVPPAGCSDAGGHRRTGSRMTRAFTNDRHIHRRRCLPGPRGILSRGDAAQPAGVCGVERFASDPPARPAQCADGDRRRHTGCRRRLDRRPDHRRRCLRHRRHPARRALPRQGCARGIANGQTLDNGQHRQRPGRPRGRAAYARDRHDHRWPRHTHPRRPLALPRCTGRRRAGRHRGRPR